MPSPSIDGIELVERRDARYVVNTTPVAIDRLRYLTVTFGPNYASAVPTFEITDIPSLGAVQIEEVDRYEDGMIVWQISEIDWSDGTTYRGTEKWSGLPRRWSDDWSVVDREKTQIGEPDPPQVFDDDEEPSSDDDGSNPTS